MTEEHSQAGAETGGPSPAGGPSAEAWAQVGRQFTALGARVQQHLAAHGADNPEAKERIEEALRGLGDAIDRGVAAIGEAARDEQVQAEAKQTASSVLTAIGDSFDDFAASLRTKWQARREPGA